MTIAAATEFHATRDGLSQLRRRWEVRSPRAALLLVHGIGEHSGRYLHLGERLASVGIDVLAFDNRGFGQSGGRRAHVDSFEEYLDDVDDLLTERRKLDVPVVLLGHSLGGLICSAHLVSGRPGPELAVLSAPALAADVPRWQRTLAPVLGRVAPRVFIKSEIDAELLSRDPAVQRDYVDDPLVFGGATAGLGRAIFETMEATSAAVDRISLPTYVVHGDDDRLVPLRASDQLGALPNVDRRVWSGLRHESFNEPERNQVIDELLEWVDAQLGSSSR